MNSHAHTWLQRHQQGLSIRHHHTHAFLYLSIWSVHRPQDWFIYTKHICANLMMVFDEISVMHKDTFFILLRCEKIDISREKYYKWLNSTKMTFFDIIMSNVYAVDIVWRGKENRDNGWKRIDDYDIRDLCVLPVPFSPLGLMRAS